MAVTHVTTHTFTGSMGGAPGDPVTVGSFDLGSRTNGYMRVTFRWDSATSVDISGVTFGGATVTVLGGTNPVASAGTRLSDFHRLLGAGGGGSQDLVVDPTSGAGAAGFTCVVDIFDGVDQTSLAAAFTGRQTATGTDNTAEMPQVTSENSDMAYFAMSYKGLAPTDVSWTAGTTKRSDSVTGNWIMSTATEPGAATVDTTATVNGSGADTGWQAISGNIEQAASGINVTLSEISAGASVQTVLWQAQLPLATIATSGSPQTLLWQTMLPLAELSKGAAIQSLTVDVGGAVTITLSAIATTADVGQGTLGALHELPPVAGGAAVQGLASPTALPVVQARATVIGLGTQGGVVAAGSLVKRHGPLPFH